MLPYKKNFITRIMLKEPAAKFLVFFFRLRNIIPPVVSNEAVLAAWKIMMVPDAVPLTQDGFTVL